MSLLENLKFKGKLKGEYNKQPFIIDSSERLIRIDVEHLELLKVGKDLLFDYLKQLQNSPTWNQLMEEIDIEVYLEKELIARLGKSAKPSFMTSFIGIKNLEIVTNSRMKDLMSLM